LTTYLFNYFIFFLTKNTTTKKRVRNGCNAYPKFAWINPEPLGVWQYRQSISIIQQLVSNRMFPLTLKGLEEAMRMLSK
jgi:uncharacterized protein with von Willebrand factor type A (vWA) domain